jgi:hypothetical protein
MLPLQGAVDAYLMGSCFAAARRAAGGDEELRRRVEEAHLRRGGPSAAELLADGALLTMPTGACHASHALAAPA